MSSPELRIIGDAECRQVTGCDFDCAGQHPAAQPSQASAKAALDSCLYPQELPFLAEERADVTILFGGLTWKHERLIEGLLAGAGYRCQALPETDRAAHELERNSARAACATRFTLRPATSSGFCASLKRPGSIVQRLSGDTINHILAFCYNDTRVIRWLFKQALHGFQGVHGNME